MISILHLSILVLLVGALIYCYHHSSSWYEHFEPIEKVELGTKTPKKNSSMLLLHYGSINLEQSKRAETVKQYAEKHKLDYYNATTNIGSSLWSLILTIFDELKYEYLVIVPSQVYVHNLSSDPRVLLSHAGDASMILARNELQPKQLNVDVMILRSCEWTKYKLYQFFYRQQDQPDTGISNDIVLDQLYTSFVHKTFEEFEEYLNMGIPYMLNNICVYNEHALLSSQSELFRYLERPAPASADQKPLPSIQMHPWTNIQHPRFTRIQSDNINKIDAKPQEGLRIPKIIFQTMETHLTTVNIRSCIDQVRTLNTGYKYYYFNSYDCRRFIQEHYPKVLDAYDVLLPGAYKADLWRYCVLHKYGGFYMDSRMYPYLAFDSIVNKETEFLSCIDGTPNMLYQAILGVTPQSDVMQYAIDECLENIKRRQNRIGDLAITGPRVMGRALNKWLKRSPSKSLDDIEDRRILLLRWNSIKVPKYLMYEDEIFACHKYTKLFSDAEIENETSLWMILTGKEHYSASYRNNRIYKDELFR